ncbi:MAG: DUF192 domain-containing protein [Gemmatimonadetes bacterium]|nr:DUF192 domain-containing protein [Gemmatimonadota bacterium]
MQAREDFHKAGCGRLPMVLATAILAWLAACSGQDSRISQQGVTLLAEASPPTPPASPIGPPAGHAWIIFGADTVLAEVAATADERAEGLMYREAVPDGTGMLFVFPDVSVRGFWMANTYVPLDIAFMDASFNVVDIIPMQPLVTETYTSRAPAMYGLEVRQGWFGDNGVGIGSRAQVVFGVPAGR